MRMLAMPLVVTVLAGCSSYDRIQGTTFEPIGTGEFRFVAFADSIYPLDSPGGERERMLWLEQYLADNKLCPAGYTVTERKPVILTVSPIGLGNTYRVFYRGRCK